MKLEITQYNKKIKEREKHGFLQGNNGLVRKMTNKKKNTEVKENRKSREKQEKHYMRTCMKKHENKRKQLVSCRGKKTEM